MKAWPFLISSSRYSDYKTVVLPDFIIAANAEREIIRASDGSFQTGEGQAIYLRGFRELVGPINIVLRARIGNTRMLGKSDDQPLIDGHGRPIPVFEGIVLREEGKEPFTTAQLDKALAQTKPHFARFWEDKECRKWQPIALSSFDLPAPEGNPLSVTYKQSPTISHQTPAIPTANITAGDLKQAYGDVFSQDQSQEKKTSKHSSRTLLSSATSPNSATNSCAASASSGGVVLKTPPSDDRSDFGKAFGTWSVYVLSIIISAGLCLALFVPLLTLKVIGTVVAVFGTLVFIKSLR